MGQFSWLDCKTGEQVVDGKYRNVYLLVPKEFGGKNILERCYDGYGTFGGHDVYDLVALWNRDYIDASFIERPTLEQYGNDEKYYNMALERYRKACYRLTDFQMHKCEDYMVSHYGTDYLREIGIDIACYDEDNARLKYPIKITHDKSAVYEDCEPSPSDPDQGWEE